MKYVVCRINKGKKASEIIQDLNIAKAIYWIQVAWEDISTDTIVHCFQKCGFKKSWANSTCKDTRIDEEFATFLNQFCDDDDITVEEFITCDDNVMTSPGQINTDLVDWREKAREEAIEDVLPNDLNRNEGQNPKVISNDEDHENIVCSELTASQALQYLHELLEFSIAKNDETLSGLFLKVISRLKT